MGLFDSISGAVGGVLQNATPAGWFGAYDGLGGQNGAPGINYGSMPQRPGFQSLLQQDANGKYTDNHMMPADLQKQQILGPEGAQALKDRAMATGPSAWAQMQNQQQGLNEANQLGQVSKQGNSSLQAAQNGIARSGGLHSGVGASLASQNMRDQMLQNQQVRQAGFGQRLGIAQQDDSQKTALLQNLQNQDQNNNQFNITNSIAEKRAGDVAAQTAYQSQMQGWAAGQQGNAIAKSGKK